MKKIMYKKSDYITHVEEQRISNQKEKHFLKIKKKSKHRILYFQIPPQKSI